MTSNDAAELNEQFKEFEMLQKLKQSNNNNDKVSKQQSFEGDVETAIDENLFKNANDEFEKEWQSAFTHTSAVEQQTSQLENLDDLISLNNNNNNSGSFLKTFLPSQLLNKNPEGPVLQPQNLVTKPVKPQESANKNPVKVYIQLYFLF